jgi:hypothetical protein
MALQTIGSWEIVLDITQIILGGFILLCLIRNRIKYKQLFLKAPTGENMQNFNTEFIIEAIRQQSNLAFTHILETIAKERQTLDTYFELRDTQIASKMRVAAPGRIAAQIPNAEATDQNAADTIYGEIENLASQGMSLADISEDLNVPKGEVELVLKLKRLSAESTKNRNHPHA